MGGDSHPIPPARTTQTGSTSPQTKLKNINFEIMRGSCIASQTFVSLFYVGCFDLRSNVQVFINFITFGDTSLICSATSSFSTQGGAQYNRYFVDPETLL